MHQTTNRHLARLAGIALLTGSLLFGGAAWATPPVEEGWPQSHLPQNDPGPGQPGYARVTPSKAPADGMTDAQLKAQDPDGYAAVATERASIERALLARVHARLKAGGIAVSPGRKLTARQAEAATALLADSPWSPYGYTKFRLVPSSSTYARNGYLGTLYFTYGIYSPVTDSYKWYTVSWPARSGNNKPADQDLPGVGPIPEYKWTLGFMNGTWYGYQADLRDSFSPGKWRLDPWTSGPFGRGTLEIHGGVNEHEFGATSGCVRLHSKNIPALKSYYDNRMANKKDVTTAKLTVVY